MNLTVRINGKEYRDTCVQGVTFAEEFSETLDSASIVLTHIPQIEDLRPYDDVLIYDSNYDEYSYSNLSSGQTMINGLVSFNEQLVAWRNGGKSWDGFYYEEGELKGQPFYRHFLVDQYTENIINLGEGIYSYTIELFSETKGLESVQIPNISITQPLNKSKRKSITEYIEQYINLYSPVFKSGSVDGTWMYVKKYSVSQAVRDKFRNTFCPEFSIPNPTLRDVLSQLMIVSDCIPYIKDDVLYFMDISERGDQFDIQVEKEAGRINYISGSMTSSDYCDGVRRQYSGALAAEGLCTYTEYLGFRTQSAIMSLSDLTITTSHPIYKVNKMYMCYYKKALVSSDGVSSDKYILCRQDISPLVKLDSEWNLLKQDWRDLEGDNPEPKDVGSLSGYKLSTVYYSQGGNTIAGWGTSYNVADVHFLQVFQLQRTYIENILRFMDTYYPYGIDGRHFYLSFVPGTQNYLGAYELDTDALKSNLANLYAPQGLVSAARMKGLFFQIEYTGFYSGALIHSKDSGRDAIIHNDNSSSSLALLEKDGLNEKEKVNRFANKTILIKGRCFNFSNIIDLGRVTKIGADDDVIIFRREYSIYNNEFKVSYAGIKNYVLKNYFTSVYAKYRTYQLMSYGESVERAETQKTFYRLSKTDKTFDEKAWTEYYDIIPKLFSAFAPSKQRETLEYNKTDDNINYAGFVNWSRDKGDKMYLADEHTFTSGKSLCFNMKMMDNISGGNHITEWSCEYQPLIARPSVDSNYTLGTQQDWYDVVDSDETGNIENMRFVWGHKKSAQHPVAESNDAGNFYDELEELPAQDYVVSRSTESEIGDYEPFLEQNYNPIHKDNKERINMTIQLEAFSNESDVVVGEWLPKLSDLFGAYNKSNEAYSKDFVFLAEAKDLGDMRVFLSGDTFNPGVLDGMVEGNLDSIGSSFQDIQFNVNFDGAVRGEPFKMTFVGNKIKRIERTAQLPYDFVMYGNGSYIWNEGDQYLETSGQWNENTPIYGYVSGSTYNRFHFADIPLVGLDTSGDVGVYSFFLFVDKTAEIEIKQNMFLHISNEKMPKDIEYIEYDIDGPLIFSDKKVNDIFQIRQEINGDAKCNYIYVDLENLDVSAGGSIQYWYFNDKGSYSRNYKKEEYVINGAYSYDSAKSAYRFVFGVNVTQEDIDRGYIKIYISESQNRDERVYDGANGEKIGIVLNTFGKLSLLDDRRYIKTGNNDKCDINLVFSTGVSQIDVIVDGNKTTYTEDVKITITGKHIILLDAIAADYYYIANPSKVIDTGYYKEYEFAPVAVHTTIIKLRPRLGISLIYYRLSNRSQWYSSEQDVDLSLFKEYNPEEYVELYAIADGESGYVYWDYPGEYRTLKIYSNNVEQLFSPMATSGNWANIASSNWLSKEGTFVNIYDKQDFGRSATTGQLKRIRDYKIEFEYKVGTTIADSQTYAETIYGFDYSVGSEYNLHLPGNITVSLKWEEGDKITIQAIGRAVYINAKATDIKGLL